jgi:hypothetical protein
MPCHGGRESIEGSGSRIRFHKGQELETLHRPRPAKEAKKYQVQAPARSRTMTNTLTY